MFGFLKSSVGAKLVMASTGIVLLLFVLVHMLGNLQLYLGQEAYNSYAAFLKGLPEILWLVRAILLACVLLHLLSGWRLAWLNQQARPIAYSRKSYVRANLSSRTMVLSSLVVVSFIVYHLAHFTLGATNTHYHLKDTLGRHDVYSMLIYEFQQPVIALTYMFSMFCLAMHLHHGASSIFQTLGIFHPGLSRLLRRVGPTYAWVILLGNISFPLSVQLGWVVPPIGLAS